MNKEKAKRLIDVGDETRFSKAGNIILHFSRASWADVKRIEQLSDEELINEYHRLARIYKQCPTIYEIQLESLCCWEVESRGLWNKSKEMWLKQNEV